MEQPSRNAIHSSPVIETDDILAAIARRKWRYVFLLIVVFFTSYYVLRYRLLHYESSTTLIVMDGFKTETRPNSNGLPDFMVSTDSYNRLLQIIQSTAMYDHLIRHFGLFNRYEIDTTREFHYEKAVAILKSRISLVKTPFNSVVVSVSDPVRQHSVEMANEVAQYADTLYRKTMIRVQQSRVDIYAAQLRDLSAQVTAQETMLNSLIDRFPGQASAQRKMAEQELVDALVKLTQSVEDFRAKYTEQALVLQFFQRDDLPTVIQQQAALTGRTSFFLTSIGYSLLTTVLVSLLIIIGHYLLLRFGHHLDHFTA